MFYDFISRRYYRIVAAEDFTGQRDCPTQAPVLYLQRLPGNSPPFPVPREALHEALAAHVVIGGVNGSSRARRRPQQTLGSVRRGIGPNFSVLCDPEQRFAFRETLTGLESFRGRAKVYGMNPLPRSTAQSKRVRATQP